MFLHSFVRKIHYGEGNIKTTAILVLGMNVSFLYPIMLKNVSLVMCDVWFCFPIYFLPDITANPFDFMFNVPKELYLKLWENQIENSIPVQM